MTLREALIDGNYSEAEEEIGDLREEEVIQDFIYTASHAEEPLLVLVDSVREALDYFPEGNPSILESCTEVICRADKREWEEPENHRHKRETLKAYIASLRRGRKEEKRHYLASEVAEKIGLDTLGRVWINMSCEESGDMGEVFVTGSACRRSLFLLEKDSIDPLLYWTSSYLADHVPRERVKPAGIAGYSELAYDTDLMRSVSSHPGPGGGNMVFLHRVKQNLNSLSRHYLHHLLQDLEKDTSPGNTVIPDTEKEATVEDLEESLRNGDKEEASAAVKYLIPDSYEEVYRTILDFAAEDMEPETFTTVHAACDLSRSMGMDSHLPVVQAVKLIV